MKLIGPVLGALALAASLSGWMGSQSRIKPAAKPHSQPYTGDWESAVIKFAPDTKDTLHLAPDGTYSEKIEEGKGRHTDSGIYKHGTTDLPSEGGGTTQNPVLELYERTNDGRAATKEERRYPRRLIYESDGGQEILTDFMEEVLARPGQVAAVAAEMKAAQSPPPKPIALGAADKKLTAAWKAIWSVSIPSRPRLESQVIVAHSRHGDVLVTDSPDARYLIGLNGQEVASYRHQPYQYLLALRGSAEDRVAEYGTWDASVRVCSLDGKLLWSHADNSGVDCACPVDMGLAISYNGGGGAVMLDAAGKQVWRLKNLGNALSIAQLAWQSGRPSGVLIAADGMLFADAHGLVLRKIDNEAGAVYGAELNGKEEALGLGTTEHSGLSLGCYALDGKRLWRAQTKGDFAFLHQPFLVGRFFGDGVVIGLVDEGGQVQFFDAHGKSIGVWATGKDVIGACVVRGTKQDDVVLRTRDRLERFRWAGTR